MGDSVMGDFKVLTFSHFIKLSSKEMICISHDPSILQWESWRIRIGSFHPGGLIHEISTIRAHPDPIGTVENSTSMLRWMIGFDLMIKRSMIRILNSDRDSVVWKKNSVLRKKNEKFLIFCAGPGSGRFCALRVFWRFSLSFFSFPCFGFALALT